ncbi:hypothetical protein C8Q74DRAFT_860602 [Fomes fomentarius]|nr:hypothetical protein C8Q74DRAFT_860602 [Fomes fomentarius]
MITYTGLPDEKKALPPHPHLNQDADPFNPPEYDSLSIPHDPIHPQTFPRMRPSGPSELPYSYVHGNASPSGYLASPAPTGTVMRESQSPSWPTSSTLSVSTVPDGPSRSAQFRAHSPSQPEPSRTLRKIRSSEALNSPKQPSTDRVSSKKSPSKKSKSRSKTNSESESDPEGKGSGSKMAHAFSAGLLAIVVPPLAVAGAAIAASGFIVYGTGKLLEGIGRGISVGPEKAWEAYGRTRNARRMRRAFGRGEKSDWVQNSSEKAGTESEEERP